MWRAGAVQLNAACVVVHSSRPLNRPCVASSCVHQLSAPRQADQQKSVCISPELRRPTGHHNQTHPEKTPTVCGGVVGVCRATRKKKPTLVHKAAILNSLTGLYQEANKRDSKCDTVHFVCASANSGAMYPINSDHRRFVPT